MPQAGPTKLRFALLGPGVSLVGSPSPASCGHTLIELGGDTVVPAAP